MAERVDLDALTVLADAATAQRWGTYQTHPDGHFIATRIPDVGGMKWGIRIAQATAAADQAFIAAVDPATVLALVAELQELRRFNDHIRKVAAGSGRPRVNTVNTVVANFDRLIAPSTPDRSENPNTDSTDAP